VKAEIVNHAEDNRYSSAIDWAGGKGLLEVTVVKPEEFNGLKILIIQ